MNKHINYKEGFVVFLDRDGVINQCALPHNYIKSWEEFIFLDKVAEAIQIFNEAGFRAIIITNQRGIDRGLLTPQELETIHNNMLVSLREQNAIIEDIFVCPHEIGICHCRKPDIGLFLQAEKIYKVDKEYSYMIGDSFTDIYAGKRYGVATVLIGNENNKEVADYYFNSLYDAAKSLTRINR